MTGELITGGSALRVLPSEIGSVVPVIDIADMIGYNRSSITKTIDKNEAAFEGLKTFQTLPTPGGNQRFLCLNHTGTERLFLLLSPSSKTKKDLFKRVEEFRLKAFCKMESEKEIAPVQQPPTQELDEVVAYDLIEAKQIAKLTDTDPKALQAAILRKHGYPEIADVISPPAPSYVHGETGWYNPSGLVELCNDPNLTPERLNQYLANYRENGEWRPFQVRDRILKIWRLTPRGLEHGREYAFNLGNGHSEPRISWRESILYASGLKRPLSESQMALPARAGA